MNSSSSNPINRFSWILNIKSEILLNSSLLLIIFCRYFSDNVFCSYEPERLNALPPSPTDLVPQVCSLIQLLLLTTSWEPRAKTKAQIWCKMTFMLHRAFLIYIYYLQTLHSVLVKTKL